MPYIIFLIPALLAAQLILTLVLNKGEICPGQRGRVHKTLPVLLIGWVLVIVQLPLAVLPLLALTYFTVKVKTGKTRDAGPLNMLTIANGLAALAWVSVALRANLPLAGLSLTLGGTLGALLAHVMLTQARTRLQAFHRLLPFGGFAGAILSLPFLLWFLSQFDEAALAAITTPLIGALIAMVVALIVWAGHLLLNKTVNRWQLVGAFCLLVVSSGLQLSLF
ncbi:hypothetical protein [Photobacterium jeanii]|nr:hypothetical protein [Photobacterium jeanii]